MKSVRISSTARAMFRTLLRQGAAKFGAKVASEKRSLVLQCIKTYLASHPHNGLRSPDDDFYYYPVGNTPFTVVYEFDDTELRVLFIVHKSSDRRRLHPADVEW